jgi:hypothetical protein
VCDEDTKIAQSVQRILYRIAPDVRASALVRLNASERAPADRNPV